MQLILHFRSPADSAEREKAHSCPRSLTEDADVLRSPATLGPAERVLSTRRDQCQAPIKTVYTPATENRVNVPEW